jgi:hypothetical protein
VSRLTWRVADSLTGKLVGRLSPSAWEWNDPLTGSAQASLTVPIPADSSQVARLADLVRPHIRQVVVHDELGRWWFGGPVLADPERTEDDNLIIPVADWRAWFYAAPIRPNTDESRRDYIRVTGSAGGQVEQNQAIADLAALGLDTVGAPRLVVDTPTSSGINRDVTHRMFKMTGEAMDNVARRERGPDWWTYIAADPMDATKVVAHLAVAWPERSVTTSPIVLRHSRGPVLRHTQGAGGNILTYAWPRGSVPPSRVYGVGPTPPPGEEWAVAEDIDLTAGTRLAWDEVWQLPEGVATPDSAFEHSLARLQAHSQAEGVVEMTVKPDATDLYSWGPGDRARLIVSDGWREVDKPSVRILSRTLSGRGGHVTGVRLTVNLSALEANVETPETEIVE